MEAAFVRITSAFTAPQPDGAWRKLYIELDEADWERILELGEIPEFLREPEGAMYSTAKKYRIMQRAADRLLIVQMAKEELISKEEAVMQIKALDA